MPGAESASDALNRLLAEKGVRETCPMCDNDRWWLISTPGMHTFVAVTAGPTFEVYTFACTNCGWVRQHGKDILEGTIVAPASGAANDG
jgi:hypothetical protein